LIKVWLHEKVKQEKSVESAKMEGKGN